MALGIAVTHQCRASVSIPKLQCCCCMSCCVLSGVSLLWGGAGDLSVLSHCKAHQENLSGSFVFWSSAGSELPSPGVKMCV